MFTEWNDRRLQLEKICKSTHLRKQQVFNRHYKEFGERKTKSVSPEDIEEFLEEQIPEHKLSDKAFSNLKTVTRGFQKRVKKRKLNHVDNKLIMGQMGHTDILCTENHYHRNRRSIDAKVQILSDIPEFQAK